ncbi:hypothetical protein V8J88_21215 [Massilia sp. W12]|uniref:hypothetical protein n=1 Tax=Massilia sp. W12 TaxID=3126507 RepID=UPI0030CE07B1
MGDLLSVLCKLRADMSAPDQVDEDNLYELNWEIETELGLGVMLADLDQGQARTLPPELSAFFGALKYFQCINLIYSTLNHDGLLALFYNETSQRIEQLRHCLLACDDPLAPWFAQACELLTPLFSLQDGANFVSRNPGLTPASVLTPAQADAFDDIEFEFEELEAESWARALQKYRAAR